MKPIFTPYIYNSRCMCRGQLSITKKRKSRIRSEGEGKPVLYPNAKDLKYQTFLMKYEIKYEKKLSSIAKCLLNSFEQKYIYYAIDDILYALKSNSIERENLLSLLYAPVLSLQNNFSINFFDIWIQDIYINEVSKINKFLTNKSSNLESFTYITIVLRYKVKPLVSKQRSLW